MKRFLEILASIVLIILLGLGVSAILDFQSFKDFQNGQVQEQPLPDNNTEDITPVVASISDCTFFGKSFKGYNGTAEHIILPTSYSTNSVGEYIEGETTKITTIDLNSFKGNDTLKTVIIPEGYTTISSSAFEACLELSKVDLPSTLTKIDSYAFRNCCNLIDVTIPASVTTLGQEAFSYCCNLESVKIEETCPLTIINQKVFYYCLRLKDVELSNSITEIGISAFQYCYSLESINLEEGITKLGNYALSYTNMSTVKLPSTLITLGQYALTYNSSLKNITIPASVTSIGNACLQDCENLEYVVMEGSMPPTLSGSNVVGSNKPVYVLDDAVESYKADSTWTQYTNYIYPVSELVLEA